MLNYIMIQYKDEKVFNMQKEKSQPGNEEVNGFPIVAIGASAGGLEAVKELLQNLAPDTGLGYVYIQHLDPTRAIVTSCLEPVFSIMIAALALGELVRPLQVLGIIVVLSAVVVVQLPRGDEGAGCLNPPDRRTAIWPI